MTTVCESLCETVCECIESVAIHPIAEVIFVGGDCMWASPSRGIYTEEPAMSHFKGSVDFVPYSSYCHGWLVANLQLEEVWNKRWTKNVCVHCPLSRYIPKNESSASTKFEQILAY